jgi:hypothetical protein
MEPSQHKKFCPRGLLRIKPGERKEREKKKRKKIIVNLLFGTDSPSPGQSGDTRREISSEEENLKDKSKWWSPHCIHITFQHCLISRPEMCLTLLVFTQTMGMDLTGRTYR